MSKHILETIFGSRLRVKVLKFVFRHHPASFDLRMLATVTQEPITLLRRELETLRVAGLIKKKSG